jgi:predicted phosphoribosyltransferase
MTWPRSLYEDRADAGLTLADHVLARMGDGDTVVLGLPRGGVPVALPVAEALGAPLDILAVRKIGVPGHTELAMGAVASGGVRIANLEVLDSLAIEQEEFAAAAVLAEAALQDLERRLRPDRPPPAVLDHLVILVDDGLATGSTMRAAIEAVGERGARSVVVAVPVGAVRSVAALRPLAAEVICPAMPTPFRAVGFAYEDFSEVTDDEVRKLLEHAWRLGL